MAKQHHQYYIGRQGNLLYYQWRDVYCIRTKGSLDKKRFDEDPAFAGSRKRAVEFGVASKLAAEVYHLLPQALKKRGFIGTLTGWAHRKLLSGKSREEVKLELLKACGMAVEETVSKETAVNSTDFYSGKGSLLIPPAHLSLSCKCLHLTENTVVQHPIFEREIQKE